MRGNSSGPIAMLSSSPANGRAKGQVSSEPSSAPAWAKLGTMPAASQINAATARRMFPPVPEEPPARSVRLVPVMRRAGIHMQRHGEAQNRKRCLCHHLADDRQRALDLCVLDLEDQLVVHLQQHLG